MIIGCDIGGVIKNLISNQPIPLAIDTLHQLMLNDHQIILISKCGHNYQTSTIQWLKDYQLDHIPVIFCLSYEDKVEIAKLHQVQVMIDDKIQVLKSFPTTINKVWFCDDEQKIKGTRKFQPDLMANLHLTRSWNEIYHVIECFN